MGSNVPDSVAVIDYRRHGMVLQWQILSGQWVACDVPPALVHGVALIRPSGPNICIYGRGGRLHLQVGSDQFALAETSPRIKFGRGLASFGLRKRFSVESSTGAGLFGHTYWGGQGDDFFSGWRHAPPTRNGGPPMAVSGLKASTPRHFAPADGYTSARVRGATARPPRMR